MYAPTIVLSTHIIRNGLTSDDFLRVFLLHELGHIDHARRVYFRKVPEIEDTDIDAAEAEADDFVVVCGQKDVLINLLERIENIRIAKGLEETVNIRRLQRLRSLDVE
jgi:Zn-dependent protease with chaperone function